MEIYLRIYRWSMQMKMRMGLYTVVLIFFKSICNYLQGQTTVDIMDLLTMWATGLVFAILESFVLQTEQKSVWRTVIWFLLANIVFLGGAAGFAWFSQVSLAVKIGLVLILEISLFAMWFGDNVAMRADSVCLNRRLKQFQQKQKETGDKL